MFGINLVPGQGAHTFAIWRKTGGWAAEGRTCAGKYEPAGNSFPGMLTHAGQKEIEQWKQSGHPVTHTIISFHAVTGARATDYLALEDGRKFYIQGIKKPGDLGAVMLYYVEQRYDLEAEFRGENHDK